MLHFLAQIITDPETVPSIPPAVGTWIMGALGAFALYEKLTKIFGRAPVEKREISGTIENRKASEPADKTEVEAELEEIKQDIKGLRDLITTKAESTKQHIDTKKDELAKAGQERADKITDHINAEMKTIRADMNQRIEATHKGIEEARKDIQKAALKDTEHDVEIRNIKGVQNHHGLKIDQINQRLPPKRNNP